MYQQIMINGLTVNIVKVKGIQNNGAWLNVYVDNADNVGVAVSCHSLPKQWFDGSSRDVVKTSGNEYKKI